MRVEGDLHEIALLAAGKPMDGLNGSEGPCIAYLRAVSAYSGEYTESAIMSFAPLVVSAGTTRASINSVYAGVRRTLELLGCEPEGYERDMEYLSSMDNSHARAIATHLSAVRDFRVKNKAFAIEGAGLALGLWVRSVGLHEHAAEILGEIMLWDGQQRENTR